MRTQPTKSEYVLSHVVCAAAIILAIAGCQQSSNISDPPPVSGGKPGFIFTSTPADAYLFAFNNRLMNGSGGHSESQSQQTYFYTSGGSPIAANAVSINSQSLSVSVGIQAGIKTVGYDGANHIWSVTGNSNVPTYSDTVISPTRITITEPDAMVDTIIKSSGTTITYSSPGTDSVLITLSYDYPASVRRDTTISPSVWNKQYWVANTGSHTVPSSAFSTLSPSTGIVGISVLAFKKEEKMVSGKRCLAYSVVATSSYHPFK